MKLGPQILVWKRGSMTKKYMLEDRNIFDQDIWWETICDILM